MADVIDQANDRAARDLLLAQQQRRPEGPQACGTCHNCGEPVASRLRWCDAQCRDDWERDHV
ncbi:hypothetical protein [Denitromonas halophila]|uniref:DUF2116 family Zn-ribbon domain-containing protein n=1 Tax=Denitromonas halophila TaxID=1629404 RepID=A0A557QLQ9_9RHOO|nr:hypothetical protein [Denitromonas halophila]TVO53834.1 hypothetical protein FHP91_13635 [Denitromonas halophila]